MTYPVPGIARRLMAGAVFGALLALNPWTLTPDLRIVAKAAFAQTDSSGGGGGGGGR